MVAEPATGVTCAVSVKGLPEVVTVTEARFATCVVVATTATDVELEVLPE
jgi:hypothetical protein